MADERHSALPAYSDWLSQRLNLYQSFVRRLVDHPGEKGAIVEEAVKSTLREVLPRRFSIGTGFVVNSAREQSAQMDAIIFDNESNKPVTLEGGVGLFPIECVYGVVEVKSVVNASAVRSYVKAISHLRKMAASGKFFVRYEAQHTAQRRAVSTAQYVRSTLPPRSFLFGLTTTFRTPEQFAGKFGDLCRTIGGHSHSTIILEKSWVIRQVPYSEPTQFEISRENALETFFVHLIDAVQSLVLGPVHLPAYLPAALTKPSLFTLPGRDRAGSA